MKRILTISNRDLAEYCAEKHELKTAGVFSSGIYFKDDKGKILMLHDRTYGNLPFGLAGKDINDRAKNLGISVEAVLHLEHNRLLFDNGSMFAGIEYRPYVSVKPVSNAAEGIDFLQNSGGEFLKMQNRSGLSLFSVKDSMQIKPNEPDDIFALAGLAGIQKIEQGLRMESIAKLSTGLDGVLGLGRGLTPSFDDFITGMISALNFFAREWGIELAARAEICSLIVKKAEKRTNQYSAAYLLAAARGNCFSMIEDVIAASGGDAWPAAAGRLISIGGSSGADMMAGVVFAARIINEITAETPTKKVGMIVAEV